MADLVGVRVGMNIEVNGTMYGQCIVIGNDGWDYRTKEELDALPLIMATPDQVRVMIRMLTDLANNYDRAARGEVAA